MKPNARIPQKKKKMALYEVFSKGLSNSRHSRELESLHTGAAPQVSPSVSAGIYSKAARQAQARPRMVQLNRGRVEMSVRYDVAIVVVLAAVLCVMGAYRLGERSGMRETTPAQSGGEAVMTETTQPQAPTKPATEAVQPAATVNEEAAATSSGENWIVIATCPDEGQLAAVQQYLGAYGIETQIRKIGSNYILHTKQTFDNPNRTGSDGWRMRQRIVELGKNYEPMPGYRTFDFTTAYGMKKVD
jgi:hypothetical protein